MPRLTQEQIRLAQEQAQARVLRKLQENRDAAAAAARAALDAEQGENLALTENEPDEEQAPAAPQKGSSEFDEYNFQKLLYEAQEYKNILIALSNLMRMGSMAVYPALKFTTFGVVYCVGRCGVEATDAALNPVVRDILGLVGMQISDADASRFVKAAAEGNDKCAHMLSEFAARTGTIVLGCGIFSASTMVENLDGHFATNWNDWGNQFLAAVGNTKIAQIPRKQQEMTTDLQDAAARSQIIPRPASH